MTILQMKAIRIISNAQYNDHTNPLLGGGGCYGIWDLGFEGLKILGFGIWGVKLFGIWDLGKIFGIWDLRLINLNILSEIHI